LHGACQREQERVMDIILDTNAYVADYAMRSRQFAALFEYLRKAEARLVLFKLVRDELLATYQRDFTEQVLPKWEKTKRLVVAQSHFTKPDLQKQLEALDRAVRRPEKGTVAFIESYEGVDVGEVVRRGIQRIPPASNNGEELRDVVLWLLVLAHAKRENKPVAFVSNDSGFWQQEVDALKQQIQDDIATSKSEICLFRTIESFLAVNASQERPIAPEEAARLFNDLNFGKHMLDRALAAEVPDAVLTASEMLSFRLDSGVTYDLGGGAEFAEVTYLADFRAHVQVPGYPIGTLSPIVDWAGAVGANLAGYESSPMRPLPDVSYLNHPIGQIAYDWAANRPSRSDVLYPVWADYLKNLASPPPLTNRTLRIEVTGKFSIRILDQKASTATIDSVKATVATASDTPMSTDQKEP